MTPILVLGMHRSGTSCVAAMLEAAGGRVLGPAICNWDNPLGHREALDLVRLNEDVLAGSGGHWLRAPDAVRWTPAQASARDRLLSLSGDGAPAIWKDPRTLLCWPFWADRAASAHLIGVARHPLAVARSLAAWRGLSLDEGLQLWLAHNRPLLASGAPILDFDADPDTFTAALLSSLPVSLPSPVSPQKVRAAYAADQIHHDGAPDPDEPCSPDLLAACLDLHRALLPRAPPSLSPARFPRAEIRAALLALSADDLATALACARRALALAPSPDAALAPLSSAFLRRHAGAALLTVLTDPTLPATPSLDLARAKCLLDAGRPAEAIPLLAALTALPSPLYEARNLLPTALYAANRHAEADAALVALLPDALYPFRLHAKRAEWAWQRGDRPLALSLLTDAIEAAPPWRRGRLLLRRAAWKERVGDPSSSKDREEARVVDPAYS